jgi:hypothetical protein
MSVFRFARALSMRRERRSPAAGAVVLAAVIFTAVSASTASAAGVNAIGAGSSVQVAATPADVPGAPAGLTARVAPADGVGTGQVRLTWTAPTSNGAAIGDYVIDYAELGATSTVADDGVTTATEFTISNLKNGTEYVFAVRAKNAVGTGAASDVVHATPAWTPGVPSGLTATVAPEPGAGSGEAKLSWNAPADNGGSEITDYLIQKSTDGTTWTTVDDGASPATEYTVGGLTNGAEYRFRVAAHNAVGNGPSIAISGAVTPAWTPSMPDTLAATVAPADGIGSGEVRLDWNAPADNGGKAITDYRIESSTDGDQWTAVDDGLSTDTAFTVTGLTNFTNHIFRVTAENAVGTGSSATVEATPLGMPGAPDALTAAVAPSIGVGSGEVMLAWIPLPSGVAVTDYLVESSTDGISWMAVDDGVSSLSTSTVGGLTNGTPYQFRVAAVNAVGSGEWSSPIAATPVWTPAAPGRPRASAAPASGVGPGQVKLTWTAPAGNGAAISDYVIQRSTDGTTWTVVNDGVSLSPTFTVRRLTNGTEYRLRIAAENAAGQGPWSTIVAATPVGNPAAPVGVRATAAGSGRVRLMWIAPAANGAAIRDYVIQRATGKRWTTVRDGVSTSTSSTISGLINGTSYRFRVAASNALGRGSWSIAVRATPHTAR